MPYIIIQILSSYMVEVKGLYDSTISDLAGVLLKAIESEATVYGIEPHLKDILEGDLWTFKNPSAEEVFEAYKKGAVGVFCQNVPKGDLPDIPFIESLNYKDDLGKLLDYFYRHPSSELSVIAVTGTNGKTTVSYLCAQAMQYLNHKSYYIGTLGFGALSDVKSQNLTTPGVHELHAKLADARDLNAKLVAMEASSHGLDQGRILGVAIDVAVFTNLTHDHLDYHGSINDYLQSKRQLFDMKSVAMGVINIDDPSGEWLSETLDCNVWACGINQSPRGFSRWSIGEIVHANHDGMELKIITHQAEVTLQTSLVGYFNANNLLLSHAALCMLGIDAQSAAYALSSVKLIPGRMQKLNYTMIPCSIYVDYCHTPAAMELVLSELKLYEKGKLIVVFGCGGDRDKEKRPMMGEIAERLADVVIITQDNSRSEPFSEIVGDILQGAKCPGLIEVVSSRYSAIARAMRLASTDDIVLLAGIGTDKIFVNQCQQEMSDIEIVEEIITQGVL